MIGPGSSKKRTRYTSSSVVLALIFPSHHKPSSPLYQKGSLGEHCVALVAKPLRAWDASVADRQKTFAVAPGKLTLSCANAHPAVKAVGSAVLVRSASPITQNMGARELEVHFPLPGRFGESHSLRLV